MTCDGVVARDHEVSTILGFSAQEDVHMRVAGVPVIDGHPTEPLAKIALGAGHQVTGEGAQILELMGVFRRDDEAKTMAGVFAALCESATIDFVALPTKQSGVFPIPANPVALKLGDMFGHRHGTVAGPVMPHDTGLDSDPPGRVRQAASCPGIPSAADGRAAGTGACRSEAVAGVTCLRYGAPDLTHEPCCAP